MKIEKKERIKLIVTIPAYNEEESIGKVIKEIPRKIEGIDKVEIIVISDGSTDNTVKVAKDVGADIILESVPKRGLGPTFKDGLNAAIDNGADVIVNIDADNQYNALQIPKLINPILEGKADIVLGSRFAGTIEHMTIQKKLGNKLATFVVCMASGIKISDGQTGFRAISRDAALRLVIHSGYTYTQEMIVQAAHKRMAIVEVPIEFRKRFGESRLISSVFKYAKNSVITLIRNYTYYNPLKTFSIIGGSLFLIGLLFGFKVLVHYILTGFVQPYFPTALLASVMMIIGFQIIIMGLIADIEHMNRHIMEEILYRLRQHNK